MVSFDDLPPDVTRERFLAWRYPRTGVRNPHRMTNPVWSFLAKHPEINAWSMNKHFDGPSSFEVGPAWCAKRFGQSTTALDGGARVLLGGEHEDAYDPDFWIYNDAIVFDAAGEASIYTYPVEDFAPTDFHSATRIEGRVVLVGGLGYAWARDPRTTQVHVLDTTSFAMRRLVSRGGDDESPTSATAFAPGWIHAHAAALSADGASIRVEGGEHLAFVDGGTELVRNADVWSLDVAALDEGRAVWSRLTARRWRQLELRRADGKRNGLFEFEMLRMFLPQAYEFDREQVAAYLATHGRIPSEEAFDAIYVPPLPHTAVPGDPEAHPKVVHVVVDGVDVRYHEHSDRVDLVIEGALPDDEVDALAADLKAKLEAFEGVPWAVKTLRLTGTRGRYPGAHGLDRFV